MKEIISDINPYTFTGSAILIGFLLVNEIDARFQSSVGNWLQLVGLVMQTYASQVEIYQGNNCESKNDDVSDLESLKNAIELIKKKLEEIERSCNTEK